MAQKLLSNRRIGYMTSLRKLKNDVPWRVGNGHYSGLAETMAEPNSNIIPGVGYESDLTKENCSPELWELLGGDGEDITDEEFNRFLNGEDFNKGKPNDAKA